MQRGWLLLPLLGAVFTVPARGASLELPFVRGLRAHGYYEYAIFEIDRALARKNLAAELRTTLEFERALTQVQYARSLVNPESQDKELDRAAKSLEQFTKAHAEHPLAAKAQTEQGQILLDRARVELWQLRPEDPPSKQTSARKTARRRIAEAREVFQAAHDQSKAAFEKFPKTRLDDPAVRDQRLQVESAYLRAQIDLAVCSFEDALTYEPKSDDRRERLSKAADEFEAIHVKYRSQGAGLRARLWEAKCFEERGDLAKALGIYNELAQKQGDNDTVRQIRDHATQFRLACLTAQSDKNDSLVVSEATRWLIASKDRRPTSIRMGIRWQRAIAANRLASDKEASGADHERLAKMALDDTSEVSRFPGEFQAPALAMLARLSGESTAKRAEPRDFSSGFAIARKNMDEIQALKESLDAAGGDEKAKLQSQMHEKLEETGHRLRSLLAVADAKTHGQDLNRARYFLAFVDYELGADDEAAILADYAARRLRTIDAELARESARLALAAYEHEFYAVPDAQRAVIARVAKPVAEYLVHNWPDHDRANEARITIAKLLDQSHQPLEAAQWYASVTESSERFAEAQIGAGREYWVAIQLLPKETSVTSREEQIKEWTATAQKYLERGIEKVGDPADSAGNPPDWLLVGKVAMANLDIGLGKYDEAIKLLTDPPHAVTGAVAVTDEATRPAEGVKGRPFASYVYQTLLRAEIGQHKVDASLEAMQQLEKIAGASGAEGVTGIYVSLGKEIQKEIGRLIAAGDQARLREVRASFEKFLEELAARSNSMTYGSLLWIAETYTGLGEGTSDDPTAARAYFAKAAATYQQLLDRVDADKASPLDRKLSLELRMANCLRRQGNYEKAVETVRAVIAQKPRAWDVQFLAAEILQDWGTAGEASAGRSLEAILGLRDSAGGPVWGWADLAAKLQRRAAGNSKADNEYRQKYFEARYNIPAARRQYALLQQDKATRNKVLEVALGEIQAFALVSANVSDDDWRRLDALYQDTQKDLGRAATPLRKPDLRASATSVAPTPEAKQGDQPTAATAPAATPTTTTAQPAAESSLSPEFVAIVLFLGVAATAAVVVWNMRRAKPARKAMPSFASPDSVDLPGSPARRTRPRSGNPSGNVTRRAAPRPDGAEPARKPSRPKPS